MAQRLITKHYGPIEVEKSWNVGAQHIGKLVGGGYVYLTGLPVKTKQELKAIIPPGPDLDEALEWFDSPDKFSETRIKRLMLNPDGSYEFDDGSPVESVSDLVKHLQEGPALDAALTWFVKAQEAKKGVQAEVKTKVGKAATAAKKVAARPSRKVVGAKKAPVPQAGPIEVHDSQPVMVTGQPQEVTV